MTRQECEAKLFDLMEQAVAIAQEYDPEVNHVSMFKLNDFAYIYGSARIGDDEERIVIQTDRRDMEASA
jgi:hypothetical protein